MKIGLRSARWMPGLGGRRGSLRTQLIVWNILALALLLGVLGVVVRYTVLSFLTASVDQDLDRQSQRGGPGGPPPPHDGPHFGPGEAAHFPPNQNGPGMPPFFDIHGDDHHRPPGDFPRRVPPMQNNPYRPHLFRLDGTSMMQADTRAVWDKQGFALAKLGQRHRATLDVNGEPLRVLSWPMLDRGQLIGVGQVAYNLTDVNRAVTVLDGALFTLIPVGLLGAGMGGAWLTSRVLRRIRRTTQAAERISAQDFAARLPVIGNDEFSELAETINGLLGRLQTAFNQQERLLEQQRQFTADASHELKTPLTIIQGNASMALNDPAVDDTSRHALTEIYRASDTMAHLVKDLLLLAHSDEGQLGANRIEMLAREILERAIANVPHSGKAPIRLNLEDESLTLLGNESELLRLFSNLLDNALRYTPPEGCVTLSARREGENISLQVADTGMGIAPEHLAHLGERFYRVDASRARPSGGTGLGLSICKSIVAAHGGTLAFASKVGVGTTVTITLPAPLD